MDPRRAIFGDLRPEQVDAHPVVHIHRDVAHVGGPDPQHVRRAIRDDVRLGGQVQPEGGTRSHALLAHLPARAMISGRLQRDEVGHGPAGGDLAPRTLGESEDVPREPPAEVQLDLRGRGREDPPADVHVDPGGEQVRGGAGHGPRPAHVGHESRVAEVTRPLEDHVVEVGEQVIIGHRLVRDRQRHRLPDHLCGPVTRDREIPQPGEELVPEIDGPIGERACAFGIPIEVADRGRALGRHAGPFVAASV